MDYNTMITWKLIPFLSLTTEQLYHVLKLRVDVFVVEQTCPYPELDNKDMLPDVYHLIGYDHEEVVACARLIPPNVSYSSASIGRVAIKQSHRGLHLGHQLLTQALTHCERLWPQIPIEIGAQAHLEPFYRRHGFTPSSEIYLEDGIPHLDMTRHNH